MYNQNQELEKKNWNIIKESAQIEIVLNILYIGIRLIGTKRMGLLVQRGLKGGAFGQIIYDIKEYINSYNPFVNNQNLVNISVSEVENKNEYLNNINEINNISEKIGIYSNYIEPYITIENVVYISTFIIISVMTYQLYKYFVDEYNFNNYNNNNMSEELRLEYNNVIFIKENLKDSELIKLINDLSKTDIMLNKFYNSGNSFNLNLIKYLKNSYLDLYMDALINDSKKLNLRICISLDVVEEKIIEPFLFVKDIVKVGASVITGTVGAEIIENLGEEKQEVNLVKKWGLDEIEIKNEEIVTFADGSTKDLKDVTMEDIGKMGSDEQAIKDMQKMLRKFNVPYDEEGGELIEEERKVVEPEEEQGRALEQALKKGFLYGTKGIFGDKE